MVLTIAYAIGAMSGKYLDMNIFWGICAFAFGCFLYDVFEYMKGVIETNEQ